MSEFYGMVDILLHPSPQSLTPALPVPDTNKDVKVKMSKMDDFINQNRTEFNYSQVEVLKSVMNMAEQQI